MIRSFKDRKTEALYNGRQVRQFSGFTEQATKRLTILDSATELNDLANLRSNRLEALRGDTDGQFSIRINHQWRICFVWKEDGPHDIEIVDYH